MCVAEMSAILDRFGIGDSSAINRDLFHVDYCLLYLSLYETSYRIENAAVYNSRRFLCIMF